MLLTGARAGRAHTGGGFAIGRMGLVQRRREGRGKQRLNSRWTQTQTRTHWTHAGGWPPGGPAAAAAVRSAFSHGAAEASATGPAGSECLKGTLGAGAVQRDPRHGLAQSVPRVGCALQVASSQRPSAPENTHPHPVSSAVIRRRAAPGSSPPCARLCPSGLAGQSDG